MSTTPLKVVNPLAITDATLISSDVPEAEYAEWGVTTTYALGERTLTAGTHKVYESLQTNNTGHLVTDPLWWIEVSPTNRWKLFDTSNSTQTVQSGSMSYTLRFQEPVTTLAALNLAHASSIRVRVSHTTYGLLYDQTTDMTLQPATTGWWAWFFGKKKSPTQLILQDLPAIPGVDITVDFTGGDGLAVGVLLFGQATSLGVWVQQGVKVGIQDYSRKETNDFGDTVLVRRAYAKRASFDLTISEDEIDEVQSTLTELRAIPCLWIGTNRYEATVIFGIYKQFDILISYPTYADCQLELEGLT